MISLARSDCGLRHSYMYNKVVSEDSARFEDWYKRASRAQSKVYAPILTTIPTSANY